MRPPSQLRDNFACARRNFVSALRNFVSALRNFVSTVRNFGNRRARIAGQAIPSQYERFRRQRSQSGRLQAGRSIAAPLVTAVTVEWWAWLLVPRPARPAASHLSAPCTVIYCFSSAVVSGLQLVRQCSPFQGCHEGQRPSSAPQLFLHSHLKLQERSRYPTARSKSHTRC